MDEVRQAMADALVDRALIINTRIEDFDETLALARQYDNFWCTVGVHPDNEDVFEPTTADLLTRCQHPKVVGIGETGLDYFRIGDKTIEQMEWQRERFRVHIQAALAADLPLIVHTRSASADTIRILREEGQLRARGVFHCFTETAEVARAALDLDFYISFSGILTFKNAQDLRDVVRLVPLDRILIETDSPYLAPVPHRGKPNQPAWVVHVAEQIAQIQSLTIEQVGQQTSRNFETLFQPHR
jgi:TatD DNase family protein